MTKTEAIELLNNACMRLFGCNMTEATDKQAYKALCTVVRNGMYDRRRAFCLPCSLYRKGFIVDVPLAIQEKANGLRCGLLPGHFFGGAGEKENALRVAETNRPGNVAECLHRGNYLGVEHTRRRAEFVEFLGFHIA